MKIILHTYKERKEIDIDTDRIAYINPRLNECVIHFNDNSLSIRVHEDIEEISKIIKEARGPEDA